MNILIVIAVAVVAFLAGVLIGRANPKKADKLAEIADDLKKKAQSKIKK